MFQDLILANICLVILKTGVMVRAYYEFAFAVCVNTEHSFFWENKFKLLTLHYTASYRLIFFLFLVILVCKIRDVPV